MLISEQEKQEHLKDLQERFKSLQQVNIRDSFKMLRKEALALGLVLTLEELDNMERFMLFQSEHYGPVKR
jgi:hypothetical protein